MTAIALSPLTAVPGARISGRQPGRGHAKIAGRSACHNTARNSPNGTARTRTDKPSWHEATDR